MKKLREHDECFAKVDGQMEFLVKKVLEHDERLERIEENMATKADIHEITSTLDVLVKLAEKKDQESTFMAHGIKKLDDRLVRVEDDVRQIKPLVGLAN